MSDGKWNKSKTWKKYTFCPDIFVCLGVLEVLGPTKLCSVVGINIPYRAPTKQDW